MTPKQACLNLLGLSRRASKQIAGEGLALAAIRNQTAKLVFIASDAGPTTAKKFHDKAQSYDVPVIDTFTKAELNRLLVISALFMQLPMPDLPRKWWRS